MSGARGLPVVGRVPDHEDARVHSFMAATPAEQAAELRALGLPAAVALVLVNACENRCFFCASPGTIGVPASAATPWERIRAHLEARPEGVTLLLVGGNEPTVHPDFDRTMALAREVGFERIELMTSGLHLEEPARLDAWVAAGLARVAVPVYAPTAALHDAICGTTCFERIVRGLDAAHRAGVAIDLHTLLIRRNASVLPDLARMARDRWGAVLALAPLRDKHELFRFADEALSADEARAVLDAIDADVSRLGLSVCVAPGRPRAPSLVMEMYFRTQRRRFASACEGCLDRDACPGVVDGQLDAFGERGLEPRRR